MTFPKPPFWLGYFIALVALSAMSFKPDLVFYGLLLGYVPAILMIVSNTVLLYSLLLIPLGLALRARYLASPLRLFLAMVSIVLVSGLAIGVPYISNAQYQKEVSLLTSGDRAGTLPTAPRSIAIGHPQEPSERKMEPFECGRLCAGLLYTGQADQVVHFDSSKTEFDNAHPAGRAYRIERRDGCPQPYPIDGRFASDGFADSYNALKAVLGRMTLGECLIVEQVEKSHVDAIVRLDRVHVAGRPSRYDPFSKGISRAHRVSIGIPIPGGVDWRVVRTTTVGEPLLPILIIGYRFALSPSDSPALLRRRETLGSYRFGPFVHAAFGYGPIGIEQRPQAELMRELERRLSEPGDLSESELRIFEQIVGDLIRQQTLSSGDVDFLRRIVSDPRVIRLSSMVRLAYEHRGALDPLAPVIAERFAGNDNNIGAEMASPLAKLLSNMSDEALGAVLPTVLPHLRRHIDRGGVLQLVARLGDFGPGMTDFLVEILEQPKAKPGNRLAAAEGLCRIGPPAASQATEPLLRLAESTRPGSELHHTAIVALIRLGQGDRVGDLVAALPETSYVQTRMAERKGLFPPELCEFRQRTPRPARGN